MRQPAIIGGGIGGITAAIALRRMGVDSRVHERARTLEPVGAGIWVPTNAMRVLAELGLADAVRSAGIALARTELYDARGRLLQRIEASDVLARGDPPTVSIRRATLHAILAAELAPEQIVLGHRVTRVLSDGDQVVAELDDGTEVRAGAIIAADGIHSVVRRQLAPGVRARYAGQTCFRGLAEMPPPRELAGTAREIWGRGARFGMSPVDGDRVYWFAPFRAPKGSRVAARDVRDVLRERYAGFPALVHELVDATPVASILQTDLEDLAPSPWVFGRVVLIGDAAHASTPDLGQGGAQAIEDALALAKAVEKRVDPRSAFVEYARVRAARARRVAEASRALGFVAGLRGHATCAVRDFLVRHAPAGMMRRELDELWRPAA